MERWDALTEEEQDGFSPICTEFVVELRSRSDQLDDLRGKMDEWIASGAELAWLIDPERKAVEVYRPGRKAEVREEKARSMAKGRSRGSCWSLGVCGDETLRCIAVPLVLGNPLDRG